MSSSPSPVARAFANLALRWKIFVPFALLSLVYGASGTYVFSRGTAAEARANLTSRLRDIVTVASSDLDQRQFALAGLARQVARTEGVPEGVARGDRSRLRQLVVPLAVNARRSLVVVTDARGTSLLEASAEGDGAPRVTSGGDWTDVHLVAAAAREEGTGPTLLRAGLVEHGGVPYLAVVAPIQLEAGEQAGVALAADSLPRVVRELSAVAKASLGILGVDGRVLAGARLRAPAGRDATVQTQSRLNERRVDVLYTPITIQGSRVGILGVALPSPSGLGALGSQAWKIAFLAIAVVAGAFLVGMWVARRISRPLAALVESTRALQHGELDHRARVDRTDEVGAVAASFNRMAEELETSHRTLERRVEERTGELERALRDLDRTNVRLAHASDAKSAFLASMSHELRTPLASILLAAEMLHGPSSRGMTEQRVRELGRRIQGSAKHLLGLIEDLLDLSKIEAGRLKLRRESVPLAEILTDVQGVVGPLARDKGLRLTFPHVDAERVNADPLRLRQVLVNLLTNAVKFTGPNGRVRVEVRAAGDDVAIAVSDTGVGIARKDLKRIFEPFEQAAEGAVAGAGLGLAISRRIVELHGGRLAVRSAPGAGSTFTLTVPAAPEAAAAPAPPEVGALDVAPVPATVLLVEDDPTIRELTAEMLETGGYRVAGAGDVREALAQARSADPDVVLLDLHLGESDGLEVVRRLRARPRSRRVRIVALSGSAESAEIDRAMQAGCDGYLVKPVSGRVLLQRVADFVREARAEESPDGRVSRPGARRRRTAAATRGGR